VGGIFNNGASPNLRKTNNHERVKRVEEGGRGEITKRQVKTRSEKRKKTIPNTVGESPKAPIKCRIKQRKKRKKARKRREHTKPVVKNQKWGGVSQGRWNRGDYG